jgi:nucleotide-binding universal stress UspA family protein
MTRTISRILVPTDFSATSDVALDYAMTLALRFGASVHLLHVVEDLFAGGALGSEVYLASVPAMHAELIDDAAARLARVVPAAEREMVKVTSEVRVGYPAETIREVAESEHVDLIVMGTHGRSGVAHLFLGSVAEKMVRRAPCPVLTVRDFAQSHVVAESELFASEYVPAE